MDELYPNISKETKYPWAEWVLELERLQRDIRDKIRNSPQTIYLIDPEGLKAPWNEYYTKWPEGRNKEKGILGVFSPYYSKMLLHPASDNGRRIEMSSFI